MTNNNPPVEESLSTDHVGGIAVDSAHLQEIEEQVVATPQREKKADHWPEERTVWKTSKRIPLVSDNIDVSEGETN